MMSAVLHDGAPSALGEEKSGHPDAEVVQEKANDFGVHLRHILNRPAGKPKMSL